MSGKIVQSWDYEVNCQVILDCPDVLASICPAARLAVIGNPVSHSLSPAFQNAALDACGISATYIRIQATAENLSSLCHLLSTLGFIGANITVPFKTLALDIADTVDDSARRACGANTFLFSESHITAYSTDGIGLSRAIVETWGRPLADYARIAILGAGGGAGRAAAAQCALEGCPEILLFNRTQEKLLPLIASIPCTRIASLADLPTVDLIINATSLGLAPTDPSPIPQNIALSQNQRIFDMVYAPHTTALAQTATAAHAHYANGLAMLLHQGVAAFQLWFPSYTPPISVMRAALPFV